MAEAGDQAENERGLVPGDKGRNYVDDWPKPEILCALTRFEVLAGMRDPADAATLLRALAVPAAARPVLTRIVMAENATKRDPLKHATDFAAAAKKRPA